MKRHSTTTSHRTKLSDRKVIELSGHSKKQQEDRPIDSLEAEAFLKFAGQLMELERSQDQRAEKFPASRDDSFVICELSSLNHPKRGFVLTKNTDEKDSSETLNGTAIASDRFQMKRGV